MYGTLCKNCPFKGVKRTEGSCTELFAKKFHNSCVTYDISKHQFLKEKNAEMMKTQAIEVAKQNQRTVIGIETLRKTTSDLLATVEGVQKIPLEGAQKRAAAEQELFKLLKEFEEQKKTEVREMTEEEQKEFNDAVQHINEEMPKTDTFFQELPSDVKNIPLKEEKPKMTRKANPKKTSAKKAKKEITEEKKSETNDENTVTD